MGNFIARLQNECTLTGLRIRLITRIDMIISIGLMLLYTLWLFELPRDWEPNLQQQGPLEPKQYRVFCFFVYIVALLINTFQFFTAFLLFGSVHEGVVDRLEVIATSEYYIALSFILNVILFIKFHLLLFYLDYDKQFTIVMTLPEMIFHTFSVIVILMFMNSLKKCNRVDSMDDDEEAALHGIDNKDHNKELENEMTKGAGGCVHGSNETLGL